MKDQDQTATAVTYHISLLSLAKRALCSIEQGYPRQAANTLRWAITRTEAFQRRAKAKGRRKASPPKGTAGGVL